jgi:hypothetical protein
MFLQVSNLKWNTSILRRAHLRVPFVVHGKSLGSADICAVCVIEFVLYDKPGHMPYVKKSLSLVSEDTNTPHVAMVTLSSS